MARSDPPPAKDTVTLDGGAVSLDDVERVARRRARVLVSDQAKARLIASRSALEAALSAGETLYGVNTGFGSLSRARLEGNRLTEVQKNLVLSHAAGVGAPLPEDVVRGMLFLLTASLCRGLSGVRPVLVEYLTELLNQGVTPVVPSVGSVGASGDLAPLAHAALVLIGSGEANYQGELLQGAEALSRIGLQALELEAKEGLALLNGTHLMAALGALTLSDVERVFEAALAAAAMSIDACRGTDAFLDERVHRARGQNGQSEVAHRLSRLIEGSQIVPSHLHNDPRVQDPYSLRCAPQVLGAALDAIRFSSTLIQRELGAVTDNPLVFPGDPPDPPASLGDQAHRDDQQPPAHDAQPGHVISAGNFHGMPLAIALDTLVIALTHVAGIAERRVYYMLAASDAENPLHPHLAPEPGLHSGLMIAQYVAAACCNELIGLSTPASVSNLMTSAGMEDYNSFGAYSALKAFRAVERVRQVVAIELLCAAEALEYQRPLCSGAGVERVHQAVRRVVSRRTGDRPPAPDIHALEALIHEGRVSGFDTDSIKQRD